MKEGAKCFGASAWPTFAEKKRGNTGQGETKGKIGRTRRPFSSQNPVTKELGYELYTTIQ